MNQESFTRRHRRPRALPPPDELAARVQEARTSAKLLLQLVQSTPPSEVLNHDLIKEFATRCQSASRSMTAYINCEDPAPDEDTMLTLIETSDQLSVSMSKHHRAILNARKTYGTASSPASAPPSTHGHTQATGAAPATNTSPPITTSPPQNYELNATSTYDNRQPMQPTAPATTNNLPRSTSIGGGYRYNPDDFQIQNPFADSNASAETQPYGARSYSNGINNNSNSNNNHTNPTTTTSPPPLTHNYTAFQPPTPPQPYTYGAIDSSATATAHPTPLTIPVQQQYQQYYSQDPPQSQFAVTPPRSYPPYNNSGVGGGSGSGGAGGGRTPSITQESMIVSALPPSSSGSGGGSGRGTGSVSGGRGGGDGGGAGGDPSSYPFSPISPLDSNSRAPGGRY